MCTSSPHAGRTRGARPDRSGRPAGGGRGGGRSGLDVPGVGGELAEQVEHALGAVDDDVGERGERGSPRRRPSRPAASACPRSRELARPPRTPRGRRGRRRRRGTPPASSSSTSVRDDQALVHAGRADLDHVPAGLDAPGRAARPARASVGSSRSNAASGSVEPAGVHGDGQPLLLDEGVRRRRPRAAARGSSRRNVARPCGGRGEMTRRWVEVQRSLPYWPKR